MNKKLVYSVVISGIIRFLLTGSKFSKGIENRIEVSTPLNSWKRVQEGAHLYENSVDPYEGDVYHENPLTLIASSYLIKNFNQYIPILFIILDLAASLLIYGTAKNVVKKHVSFINIGFKEKLLFKIILVHKTNQRNFELRRKD